MKKMILLTMLLFFSIIYISPHGYRGHHFPHYFHNNFYPYYNYDRVFILSEPETIFIHRIGNIYIKDDLSSDINCIDKIVFSFGINGSYNKVTKNTVYFTDEGEEVLYKSIVEFLDKSLIPDKNPIYNNLKSFSFENDKLKLNFINSNFYDKNNIFETEEYYLYTLNYSLILPYIESVKSQFDVMSTKSFKTDIKNYIKNQSNLNIAGISVFFSGLGLAGLLNIAGLITLYNSMNNGDLVPSAVPISLFSSAAGAATISLSVGIPLWAASYAKKEYIVNFQR